MEKNTEDFFSPTWSHGKYLDYWSLIHFLTGFILGIGAFFVSEERFLSLVLIFILLIIYEILETKTGVSENIENIALDVIVGSAGGATALFLLPLMVSINGILVILILTIILDMFLVSWGWKNYLKNRAFKGKFYSYIHGALLFIYFIGTISILISFYYLLIR
jgi:hypothetical protein